MKHETWHAAEADKTEHGMVVYVGCACGWKGVVDVTDCDFWEGLERIYRVRDEHMAMETLKDAVDA